MSTPKFASAGISWDGPPPCRTGATAGIHTPLRMEGLSRLLRQLRTDAGMTPEELADDAGVSKSSVYRIESGETASPDVETLRRLADALDLTLSQFFGRIEGAGPSLSEGGSRVAHATAGAPAHAQLPAQSADVREIAALKSRIERLETALGATEDVAKRLLDVAAARAKTRKTPGGKAGRSRGTRKVG